MRVCLLNDSFPPVIDGVANTVMNYARILTTQLDADALVATPAYPGADYSGYPYEVVPYQSFDTAKISAGYRAGNPVDGAAIRKMADFAPDIIHTHCPFVSTFMARMVRNETDAPVVFTYHTKFDYDIRRAVKMKTLQQASIDYVVDSIMACDEVWTVSHGAGENLKSLGYYGEYRVMENGVDFAKGRVPADEVAKATAGYDLPAGVPVFLFVGRLMTYKGLPIILDALKTLNDAGKEFRMVFVGGGADKEAMQEKAAQNGLSVDIVEENPLEAQELENSRKAENAGHAAKPEEGGSTHAGEADESCGQETASAAGLRIRHIAGTGRGKVIFVGAIHDRNVLRAWNTRGDLFLFPSVYDTNGIVVREAAACGLASVLVRGSCAAEGITDGRNGYLIDENARSMASLLERIMDDLPGLHAVGAHAMDEIYISWDEAVRKAYARYQEIIAMKQEGAFSERRLEASDHLIEAADRFARNSYEMRHNSPVVSSGMLSNFYNLRDHMEERTRQLQKDFAVWQKEGISQLRREVSAEEQEAETLAHDFTQSARRVKNGLGRLAGGGSSHKDTD